TVNCDGKIVESGPAANFDQERISNMMTGGAVSNIRRETAWEVTETPLLTARGLNLGSVFRDVDLDLQAWRVLGLSGLVGCGKIEIGLALAGLIPVDRGKGELEGAVLEHRRAERTIQYVPDDRPTQGPLPNRPLAHTTA